MGNYAVVLFKNKKKKSIIKKFITFNKCKSFYENLRQESDEVIFETLFENGKECSYELGIIGYNVKSTFPIYLKDEFGRNVRIKLEDESLSIVEICPYKKEEKIFDIRKNEKISVQSLIKDYLSGDGIKMISSLNNKIVIQKDEKISLFSLKSENDCHRFIDSLNSYFFRIKKGDCILVKDVSSAQRKYLFDLLEKSGFDKKILYRKYTTHPRQE